MSTRSSCDRRLLAVSLAALAVAGCQREADSPDAHAAKTAVARYNQALVEAFWTGDQERLAIVATEAERNRVGAIIAGLLKRRQVMVARQIEQRVASVNRLKEDLFEIETTESWVYEHRSVSAKDSPVEPKARTYRMTYQVRRNGDAWLVQHAATEDEQPGPDAPGTPR